MAVLVPWSPAGGGGGRRERDGAALLAKYLGGQLGGRGSGAEDGRGRTCGPGAGRCIERVLQTRSRAAILRSPCDIAPQ